MYFNHDIAWRQLQKHGVVTTLRSAKTPNPPSEVVVEIWRHGEDTGLRAIRKFVRDVFDDPAYDLILGEAVLHSGFPSIEEWWKAAKEMSGEQEVWRIFRVVRIS